jgi:hypothetical protein
MRGHVLRDKRGREFQANVADCVNVDRTPKVREQILEGQFHRVADPSGIGAISVEKTFFYADFGRKQFFLVLPRWDRHKWQEASNDLRDMMNHFPQFLAPSEQRKVRVVCGLAELREKVLAFDAEFDDRMVEVLKALIQYEHPFLLQQPRLNIVLDRVTTDSVEFVASYDHAPEKYRVGFPRRLVDDLFTRQDDLEEWLQEMQGALSFPEDSDPLWINHRRWSSSDRALAQLDRYARAIEGDPRVRIDIDSAAFIDMLGLLPRGSELSAAGKRDLNVLRSWAGARRRRGNRRESLKEELWEIYFGKELKGKPALLRPDLVERLWRVLDGLNDQEFEGNSFIDQIHLGLPGHNSFYDPSTDDIGIDRSSLPKGRAYDRGWFEQVVLHEVGHGVHAKHQEEVDAMLATDFGWARFRTSEKGIDQWIRAMGDYPEGATSVEKQQIRSYIRQSVGNSQKWNPPAAPHVPKDHPWHTKNFGPRLACERTAAADKTKRWYDCHEGWYCKGNLRFFVNYYYGELMIVNAAAIKCVKDRALDTYALMAPPEFFAELYMTVHAKTPSLAERAYRLDPNLVGYLLGLGRPEEEEGRQELTRPEYVDRRAPAKPKDRKRFLKRLLK